MTEKGNTKTMKAAKAKFETQVLSPSDQEWVAAMAKTIAVHSTSGAFLLLFADGEELDVYVSSES